MNTDRWKRVERVFHSAGELSRTERVIYLQSTCGEDMDLRAEVESLLDQDTGTEKSLMRTLITREAASISQEGIPNLVDTRIGPYRLMGLIGEGGMAEVYKAVRADDQYEKFVAIKLLRKNRSASFFVSRFWHERQILARLEHPYIARFLEGGATPDGVLYFVMEYIQGETLTEYCKKQDLPIRKRLELFRQICEAVQYAHRNLVIHRDLKPHNILVTADGTPKLLDFGIAKILNPEFDLPTATITSMRMMTPDYASPEQVRGETITTATDVYSLGTLLYELLANCKAHQFKTRSFTEIERVICEQEPERPSSAVMRDHNGSPAVTSETKKLKRELARELDNIVLMAMRKDPHQRYHTVAQFSDDIHRYIEGLPVRARTQTVGYRTLKFTQRHRSAVSVALSLFLLLVSFAAVMTVQTSRISKERDRANQVTQFLIDLFEVSDPGEARGNTVTAKELLNSGAVKIQSELREQPEVQAAMLDTIGCVNIKLGLYQQAVPLLRKALVFRMQAFGNENSDVASTMNHLADALKNAGEYDSAKTLATRALSIQRKLLGNDHPEIAVTLTTLGEILYEMRKYDDSESAFREALQVRLKVFGQEHVDVAGSLTNVADVLIIQGKSEEAEPLQRRALAMRHKLLGNNFPTSP